MPSVRTTIVLDDDRLNKLQDIAHKRRESFRRIVNETLRRGLLAQAPRSVRKKAFQVDAFESPFRAGVDPLRLNQA